jgi:hypothetical protein
VIALKNPPITSTSLTVSISRSSEILFSSQFIIGHERAMTNSRLPADVYVEWFVYERPLSETSVREWPVVAAFL